MQRAQKLKVHLIQGKQIKAVEIKGKSILALYNVDGKIYCSQANSTAYEFPVTNGKILQSEPFPGLWSRHWSEMEISHKSKVDSRFI